MGPFVKPVVLVLFLLTSLGSAPAALAAKPTRTVIEPPDPFVIPTGLGCAFDVGVAPIGWQAITEFDDGRTVRIGHADISMTNLDTGASYLQISRYRDVETYDPVTNDALVQVSGRIFWNLWPGDRGPFGVIGEPGAVFGTVGNVTVTFDLDTELVTSFSLDGQATDICSELS